MAVCLHGVCACVCERESTCAFWCYFCMLLTRILLYDYLKSYRTHNCFFSSCKLAPHVHVRFFCMLSAVSHHIKSVFHKTSSQTISVYTYTHTLLVHCLFLTGWLRNYAHSPFAFSINLVPLSAFIHFVHVLRYKYNLSSCWLKTLFTIHHMHFADEFFRG